MHQRVSAGRTYPIEAIFAEKLETAVARGNQNSRMKDYHDLLTLARNKIVDIPEVRVTVKATFENRGTKLTRISFEKADIETIQNYWALYLRTLEDETRNELSTDISNIIDEINTYLETNKIVSTA